MMHVYFADSFFEGDGSSRVLSSEVEERSHTNSSLCRCLRDSGTLAEEVEKCSEYGKKEHCNTLDITKAEKKNMLHGVAEKSNYSNCTIFSVP